MTIRVKQRLKCARFRIRRTRLLMQEEDSILLCPNEDCAEWFTIDDENNSILHFSFLADTKENIKRTCSSCNAMACMICLTAWHDGLTCEDYQRRLADRSQADEMTRDFVHLNTRLCPQCDQRWGKDDGCNKVTCTCGFVFCWECGVSYQYILEEGNHVHREYCPDYREWVRS